MTRYLAIDYGTVRTGLAISDPLGVVARGLVTLPSRRLSLTELSEEIRDIISEHGVTDLLLGLPKRTDGKVGEKEVAVREFATILEQVTGLKPILVDERYTTVLAQRIMQDNKVKQAKKKQVVDQIAAAVMLQDYLDSKARQQGNN